MTTKKPAKKKTKASTKQPAKKSTTKPTKKSTKKSTKHIVKKKITGNISPDKYFVLVNGQRLNHYLALADVLEDLEEEVIAYHVNEARHDFANWIRQVFNEEDLANELEGVTDKKEMRFIIYRHLVKKHLR